MQVSKKTSQSKRSLYKKSRSEILRRLRRLRVRSEFERKELKDTKRELELAKHQMAELHRQLDIVKIKSHKLYSDEMQDGNQSIHCERPLPGHQFSTKIIAMSIEIAKRVGFRAAADVMKFVFDALQIDQKVPSHDAIEQWMLRLGVSSLQDTFTSEQRVLWMSDHSSQIGSERVLLIIGIALDDLPAIGETLDFEHIKVLAVVPGKAWKTADVEREYTKLAKQIGAPVYLLCDGACELRDAAQNLEKDGEKTIVLGDLKHYAANLLEKEIGKCERFISFMSEVGLTRSRIQQTELSHFAPPTLRQKSRFMNLEPLLRWATMVLYHLDHVDSQARKDISHERMELKLGWLRGYADNLSKWSQCQEVINRSLAVINRRGPDSGTAIEVEEALNEADSTWCTESTSAYRIGSKIVEWIKTSANKLSPGDRAWLSTEILESLFGRFKQLERQHSKGGFTRLIGAIPALCKSVTPQIVRERFARFNTRELRQWLATQLGTSLSSRRNSAYNEFRKETKSSALNPT